MGKKKLLTFAAFLDSMDSTMKEKSMKKNKKTIQQMASLRLTTKRPQTFTDRKKKASKKACRGKVKI